MANLRGCADAAPRPSAAGWDDQKVGHDRAAAQARDVLSVEFKVNLLAPAAGERFVAVGRVLRPVRTLTVCAGEVRAEGASKVIAVMQATMISSTL